MAEFKTILKTGYGEYEEKKSRFLGEAIPVSNEEDVQEHLQRIRKQHYDARHHCFAYVMGEKSDKKRFSDDGEPSGTAGAPMLKVIEGSGCTDVLLVVTRYFGGTLLGTGGLVRAYTEAAQLALQNAGIVTMREGEQLQMTMEYPLYDKVSYLLRQAGIAVDDTIYTDKVAVVAKVPSEQIADLKAQLQAAGSGTIAVETLEKGFYGFDNDAAAF